MLRCSFSSWSDPYRLVQSSVLLLVVCVGTRSPSPAVTERAPLWFTLFPLNHPPPHVCYIVYRTFQEVQVRVVSRCCRLPESNWNIKTIFSVFFCLLLFSAILLVVFGMVSSQIFCFSRFIWRVFGCCVFLPTCWPKSRDEKFTQRSVTNEFPLLEALGLVFCHQKLVIPCFCANNRKLLYVEVHTYVWAYTEEFRPFL